MRSPECASGEAGLDHREQQAALRIDRAGLLMAARSYELKRQGRDHTRRPRRGVLWPGRGASWLRSGFSWLGRGVSWLGRGVSRLR